MDSATQRPPDTQGASSDDTDDGRANPAGFPTLSRRGFVGLGLAFAAGFATRGLSLPSELLAKEVSGGGLPGGLGLPDLAFAPLGLTTGQPLVEPAVRTSRNRRLSTTITARKAVVNVGGQPVETIVYEDSFPGPTLRVRPGDRLQIKLVNQLNDITNLHTHGMHLSPEGNADNVLLHVMPGESFDYEYEIGRDHASGLNWYHPHFHTKATDQVYGGMAGAIIVDGDIDRLDRIRGRTERLLILQALELNAQGQAVPFAQSFQSKQLRLVNGQLQPTISIRPGETQRWRILNATSSVFYDLRLDGHLLNQVAADGNTFDRVRHYENVLIGPGQRAEVLIQGADAGSYALRARKFDLGPIDEPEVVLATLVSGGDPVRRQKLPKRLLRFDDLSDQDIDNSRQLIFQVFPPSPPAPGQPPPPPVAKGTFKIDGKQFDETRVDQPVQLEAIEEWTLINDSDVFHPFHIHVNAFVIVAVNGEKVADVRGFEDTVPLPPRRKINGQNVPSSVTIRIRFRDFEGKSVYHCHILPHEDGGMMGIFQVSGPAVRHRRRKRRSYAPTEARTPSQPESTVESGAQPVGFWTAESGGDGADKFTCPIPGVSLIRGNLAPEAVIRRLEIENA